MLPPLTPERARAIMAALDRAHILVVGDVMLDTFVTGRVARLSPEAPVPVVLFDHESHRVGGAANVAHNVAALGGRSTLIGVTGNDEAASTLAGACRAAGITPVLVGDADRRTTMKMRIVTDRNQQVARVDYEVDTGLTAEVERQVVSAIEQRAADASAVVVSDYVKGCVTAKVMQAAIAAGRTRGIPVLVDPKVPHIATYAGATVITPNHHEAESATHLRVQTDDEARDAARRFLEQSTCEAVLMTRGDQGMWLLGPGVEGSLRAAAREVADVTGAGDTVIATLALTLASGATLVEAAHIANQAAGISVSRFGPAVVSPVELLAALGA
ncbi:MAG: D-glycero-beta-D-manno-heptose-7-phosphate kinase [Acidobacteria bacterium]|nr:D-glycero-beta-D-manno-heptose-7-phosphate kinase [Acidobacteriota bacterium]